LIGEGTSGRGGDEELRLGIDRLVTNKSIALSITEAVRDGNSDAVDALKSELEKWHRFAADTLDDAPPDVPANETISDLQNFINKNGIELRV
jgi:hypothetical protein